jgi:hypothetical protein
MATSIAQEFYKLREEWEKIDKIQSWKLAVLVAEYPDVDIIDKFIEIERSPIGVFNDIFFKFESVYQGDIIHFEKLLWEEFVSWFIPAGKPEMDMHNALFENGILKEKFIPDTTLEHSAKNLWAELLRFKQLIKDDSYNLHFCLYFPIVAYNKYHIVEWFDTIIKDVPKGIRLVTMDFAQDRKIKLSEQAQSISSCVYLHPKLDMASAIKNEMSKDSGNYDTVDLHARFRQQVIKLMDSTTETVKTSTPKEIKKLFAITNEIGTLSSRISGLLVAAQASYSINDTKKSEKYTDEALEQANIAMQNNDPTGYPVWKSCMLLKAAILYGRKERKEALKVYEELADTASKNGDPFYVMEGRRLSGHIYYELGELEIGLQQILLALASGSYLDISLRRQSTFLHAAYMALYLGSKTRSQADIQELKLQLEEWLGEDWENLLEQAGIDTATTKMKTSIFN